MGTHSGFSLKSGETIDGFAVPSTTAASANAMPINDTAGVVDVSGSTDIRSMTDCVAGRVVHLHANSVTRPKLIHNHTGSVPTANEFILLNGKDTYLQRYNLITVVGASISGTLMWLQIGAGGATVQSYAEMTMSSAAASGSIAPAGTYVKIGGTTAAGIKTSDWSVTTTSGGKLTLSAIDGNQYGDFLVQCSFTCTGTACISSWRLAKNGTTIPASQIDRKIGTSGDQGAVTVSAIMNLAFSDDVELWCTRDDSGGTLTVDTMTMTVHRLGGEI